MKIKLIGLFVLMLIALASNASPVINSRNIISPEILTIDQTIIETYRNNSNIRALQDNLKVSETQLIDAYASWFPTISFSWRKEKNRSYQNGEHIDNLSNSNRKYSKTLSINQPIFNYNGGANFLNIVYAKAAIEADRQNYLKNEQDVFIEAINRYVDILQLKDQLHLAKKNIEVHTKYLDSVSERYKVGTATKSDEARSRSKLAQAKTNLISVQGKLADSLSYFETIVGIPARNLSFPHLEVIREPVEEIKAVALDRNPSLLAAKHQNTMSSYAEKLSLMGLAPKIYMTFQTSHNQNKTIDRSFEYSSKSKYVGLVAEVPIFSPAVLLDIRKKYLGSSARDHQLINVEKSIKSQVTADYNTYQTSLISLSSDAEAVSAEETVLEAKKQEFEVGTESIIEVLNSESDLFKVRNSFIAAKANLVKSYYRIQSATGRLNSEYLGLDNVENLSSVKNNADKDHVDNKDTKILKISDKKS